MAIASGFFNSVDGDRRYDARWFAQYFSSFIANGVFPNPSNNLQVAESTNMRTNVKPGKGWINGYFVVNDSDFVLQHSVANGMLNRIDRIVMRLNYLTRQIEFVIKESTAATNPVAPALQRDAEYYELALADVYISKGITRITQANITDQRLNKTLCGIVHGTVEQVDTTTLFNQYQSWLNQQKEIYVSDFLNWSNIQKSEFDAWQSLQESDFNAWKVAQERDFITWMQNEQTDFEAWFATIQNTLDGDTVGNLLNLINAKIDSAYYVGATAPTNKKMIWID